MGDKSQHPSVRPGEDEESIVQEISILLRDGRLDMGESIEEVARTLRINRRYIEAIEEGRFEVLPGPVYTLGFIRSFGDYVGLDGEELVRRFKSVSSSTKRQSELEFPEPIPESGVPGGAVLFAGLLVAGLAYGGWYVISEDDNILSDLVAPVPEELAEQAETLPAGDTAVAVDDPLNLEETAAAPVQEEAGSSSALEETEAASIPDEVETTPDEPENADAVETAVSAVEDLTATAVEETGEAVSTIEQQAEAIVEEVTEPVDTPVVESDPDQETAVAELPAEPTSPDVPQAEPTGATASSTAPTVEESADQAAASVPHVEHVDDETAETLNATQLQALQVEMIDAPAITAVTEETESPESSEPLDVTAAPEAASQSEAAPEVAETSAEAVEEAALSATAGEAANVSDTVRDGDNIVIVAREESWVEVRDSGIDAVIMSRIMKAGDRYEVPRSGSYELQTGNIGALEFIVGGKTVPPLGAGGEVGRNIALDADSLLRRVGSGR